MGVGVEKNTGMNLYMQQFRAMFVKRVIHTMRNKIVTVTQLVMPLIFTAIAGIVIKTLPKPVPPPSLTLSMNYFDQVDTAWPYVTNITGFSNNSTYLVNGLVNSYKDYIAPLVERVEYVNNIDGYDSMADYLGYIGATNMRAYQTQYQIATEFNELPVSSNKSAAIIGFFNNQAYHTVAITLDAISNSLLNYFTDGRHTIETTNHPIPKSSNTELEEDLQKSAGLSFIVSNNVLFGQSFLTATFVVFIIKERTSKAKHIQFVSGVHVGTYWMSTYLWDFINYLIPATLQLALFAILDFEPFVADSNLGCVYLSCCYHMYNNLKRGYALYV